MSQQRKHSPNGPSSLRRRELCPASYWLEKDIPAESSEAADAGTRLHECLARLLGAQGEGELAAVYSDFESLDEAQLEMVHWCLERVQELTWPGARVLSEHYLDLRWFHPSIQGGTADLIIVEDFVRAIVVDFKFGFKRVPSAADNLQLACYAEGTRREFEVEAVQVCIIQPARAVCEVARTKVETIERAISAAAHALNPDNKPTPSEEACAYCKARGRCPAQMAIVASPGGLAGSTKEQVELLPMLKISEFLAEWEDRDIDGIVGAMRQRLMQACLTGYEDSRWKLGRGRASRVFVEQAEATLRTLCESRGKSPDQLFTKPELKTVAQVEAIVGKSKAVKAIFDPLVVTLEGKPKLERKAGSSGNAVATRAAATPADEQPNRFGILRD